MPESAHRSDFTVVGGGIVGLATAWQLQNRFSDCTVTVVEAEQNVAEHQSGHNSGVLHSGIYYKPGSQKAINCRKGKAAMQAFCDEHSVNWDRCGKIVVATDSTELESLERIAGRATENGVAFEWIHSDQIRELEPQAAGIRGLHVPEAGIVNYSKVCLKLAELITANDGKLFFNSRIVDISTSQQSVQATDSRGNRYACDTLINCGGLQCDRIARLAGLQPAVQIVPFRGEYYELRKDREYLVRNLIYPVPDPSFPFLGVHFTRMIDGGVECGPNAVLALSREGYDWSKLRIRDIAETVKFSGFRRLALKHWKAGMGEMHRSLSKAAFVRALRRLLPSIVDDDLVPGRSGVRAQAVSRDGALVDDFCIQHSPNAVHVLNAPSPGATASLAIGDSIVDQLTEPTNGPF